jgi:hypothetical protein
MRRRFFVEEFAHNAAALRGESAGHLARVLRAEPGQLYELSDGRELWLARIERVSRDEIGFALVERLPAAAPRIAISLLLSIVKMDRFEWALEKATELGVSEIVPLAAERSERALAAAARQTRAALGANPAGIRATIAPPARAGSAANRRAASRVSRRTQPACESCFPSAPVRRHCAPHFLCAPEAEKRRTPSPAR